MMKDLETERAVGFIYHHTTIDASYGGNTIHSVSDVQIRDPLVRSLRIHTDSMHAVAQIRRIYVRLTAYFEAIPTVRCNPVRFSFMQRYTRHCACKVMAEHCGRAAKL